MAAVRSLSRVWVTRPAADAGHWVQKLREGGFNAEALPLIDIAAVAGGRGLAALQQARQGLDGYAASLQDALTRAYPAYEAVGIRNPGGDYNQLAATLLQIENEFYGTIRPKRVIFPGERPLHALRERGVE